MAQDVKKNTVKKTVKSGAKAIGLKSVLVAGNDTYMTSFGHGNEAVLAAKIDGKDTVTILNNNDGRQISHVTVEPKSYTVQNQGAEKAQTDRPIVRPRQDAIRCKEKLENRYFGHVYPQDNIHIQVCYQILDIFKILTYHSNNIVYELNNLFARESGGALKDNFDFVGSLSLRNYDYQVHNPDNREDVKKEMANFDTFTKLQTLALFGKAFYKKKGQDWELKDKKDIYAILNILGLVRQLCTHGESITPNLRHDDSVLFCVDEWSQIDSNLIAVLDAVYRDAVGSVNREFDKNNSKKNYELLQEMFPNETLNDYVQEFYDFVVRKTNKNMGFSIRLLRETMLADETDQKIHGILDKRYDSVRGKLYTLFDFAVLRYYHKYPDRGEALCQKLRACRTEEDKTKCYKDEALPSGKLYAFVTNTIKRILPKMNGVRIKDVSKTQGITIANRIDANVDHFSKMIYLLTLFLDGKEINDLLTTLINKFENIAAFNATMKSLNVCHTYKNEYKLFERSDVIARELRDVNSFCRMQKVLANAKGEMYRAAVKMLGTDMSDDELNKEVQELLCLEIRKITVSAKSDCVDANDMFDFKNPTQNALIDKLMKDTGAFVPQKETEKETARKRLFEAYKKAFGKAREKNPDAAELEVSLSVKTSNKTGTRNFIASNVIESSRFAYLVRYCNVEDVKKLARNESLVRFQLEHLQNDKALLDAQLERYMKSCIDPQWRFENQKSREAAFEKLTDLIVNMAYDDKVKSVQQGARPNSEDAKDKQKKQAIIGLYLTVLYRFVKNMVYVNSRYVMAFAAHQRDSELWGINVKEKNNYLALTTRFVEAEHPLLNHHACECLRADMQNADDALLKSFRNKTAHLNVVNGLAANLEGIKASGTKDTYFSIYQYAAQTMLLNGKEEFDKKEEWKNSLATYHTYVKDMTKALCVPFGYNYPRFRNLSIEALFDENYCPIQEGTNEMEND